MPRLNIDLRFSQADVDGILRCHEMWDEYLRRNGCGRLEYVSPDPGSVVWRNMRGGTHQLGTTRMASKAEDGVVNEHLAVHGMTNLFVASSSVSLTSSQAIPTFMVIVLALRLADRLKFDPGWPVICSACRVMWPFYHAWCEMSMASIRAEARCGAREVQ